MKKISSEEISDHHFIVGLIELESSFTSFTLLARDERTEESRLLGEATMPTIGLKDRGAGAKYETITGVRFTRASMERAIGRMTSRGLADAKIDAERVDRVVCSSDAVAGFERPRQGDELLRAIGNSCEKIFGREILSSPPSSEDLFSELVANGNKVKLIARGMRRAIESRYWPLKSAVYIDLSTILSGLSTIDGSPSSMTSILTGLGGKIFDAMVKGDQSLNMVASVDLRPPKRTDRVFEDEAEDLAAKSAKLINVGRVPAGRRRVGMIPVGTGKSYETNVKLIGCDVGENGSDLPQLTRLGSRAASYGGATLRLMIDKVCAQLIGKLMKAVDDEVLLAKDTTLGISGRETVEESRRKLIINSLKEMGLDRVADRTIFVEDAALRGAVERALDLPLTKKRD